MGCRKTKRCTPACGTYLTWNLNAGRHVRTHATWLGAERVRVVPEASWLKVDRGRCTVKGGRTVRLKVRASGAEAGAESVIEIRAYERTWLPVRYE